MTAALCLLFASVLVVPDTFGTVLVATGSGHVGYTETADTIYYSAGQGPIHLTSWDYVYPRTSVRVHGWAGFDLSPLPDSATIVSARFRFFQAESVSSPPGCRLNWLDHRHASPESLFGLVTGGPGVTGVLWTDTGWNELVLDPAGLALVQSRLESNVAEFGIPCLYLWRDAEFHGANGPESLRPRLVVDYAVGVAERAGPVAQPGMSVVPSPCCGRCELRFGADPAGGVWAVRDATGRVVRRGSMSGSAGRLALDLGALPAGVYAVEFAAPSVRFRGRVVRR